MKLHRHLVAEIVAALHAIFVQGGHAERVVAEALKSHPKWGARDRRLFAESVYDLVRWRRWHWRLAGLPDAEYDQADANSIERLWLLWAAWWIQRASETPPFPECQAIGANEVSARAAASAPRVVRESIPDWLDALGETEFGSRWPGLLHALNQPAPVFLRANTLRIDAEALQQRFAAEGIATERVPGLPDALRLTERRSLAASHTYLDGWCEIQDAASQRIAPFLQAAPGMTVIDACAGGGGKSLQLAALMQNRGRVLSCDVAAAKLAELQRRAARNQAAIIEAQLLGERENPLAAWTNSVDRLLLDVPCSGLGVLRRHPDTKWKLTPAELDRLQLLQRKILSDYCAAVVIGGKLVYATCSILPGENERQIADFLESAAGQWELEEELKLWPEDGGGDGFYAARLRRRR